MIFTHEGYKVGNDARTNRNFKKKIKLRETRLFWVDEDKTKYRKDILTGVGDWPMYRLESQPTEIL